MLVTNTSLVFVSLLLALNAVANVAGTYEQNPAMFKDFEHRISKFEKSEEKMKASISALLGTNAQFRLQIDELTKRIDGYENREAEHFDELRSLKSELESYKSEGHLASVENDDKQERDDTEIHKDEYEHSKTEFKRRKTEMSKKAPHIQQKRGNVRQVLTSSPIAFTSYLDHPIKTLGKNQAIVFNQILLNEGHGYNNSSGVFHVPVTGIYLFSWAVTARKLANTPAYDVWTHLVVNGRLQIGAVAESRADSDDNQGSSSVVIRVQAGDDVWVSHTAGNLFVHGDDQERSSSFMGVILYEADESVVVGR